MREEEEKSGTTKKTQVNARIPKSLLRQVKVCAAMTGTTVQEIIESALKNELINRWSNQNG